MNRFEEVPGLEKVRNPIERVVVDKDRAEKSLFGLDIMRGAAKRRRSGFGRKFDDVRIEIGHEGSMIFYSDESRADWHSIRATT
jgi:hypothetical protein